MLCQNHEQGNFGHNKKKILKKETVLEICIHQETAPLSNSLRAVLQNGTTKDDLIPEARSLLLDVASEATKRANPGSTFLDFLH